MVMAWPQTYAHTRTQMHVHAHIHTHVRVHSYTLAWYVYLGGDSLQRPLLFYTEKVIYMLDPWFFSNIRILWPGSHRAVALWHSLPCSGSDLCCIVNFLFLPDVLFILVVIKLLYSLLAAGLKYGSVRLLAHKAISIWRLWALSNSQPGYSLLYQLYSIRQSDSEGQCDWSARFWRALCGIGQSNSEGISVGSANQIYKGYMWDQPIRFCKVMHGVSWQILRTATMYLYSVRQIGSSQSRCSLMKQTDLHSHHQHPNWSWFLQSYQKWHWK